MPGLGLGEVGLAKRQLHFIWIVDCSGSMQGLPIETLNHAIKESIGEMRDFAKLQEHAHAEVKMRAVVFSDGAQWLVAEPTPIEEFQWNDVNAGGMTDMGKAMQLVADAMDIGSMPERGLQPVLVLVTDGEPTDDFTTGLTALLEQPWGKRAVRIGIGIGSQIKEETLRRFIAHPEIEPLVARTAKQLTRYIRWASTAPLGPVIKPATQVPDSAVSPFLSPPTTPDHEDQDRDDEGPDVVDFDFN